MPRRNFTSGRKFSTTTSAVFTNRMKTSLASGSLRLSVIARLLRCRFCMSGPWRGPPMFSFGSVPGGDSILITSAPKSENWRTQLGPARTRDRSRMRKRLSADEAAMAGMEEYSSCPRVSIFEEEHHDPHCFESRNDRFRSHAGRLLEHAGLDAGQRRHQGDLDRRR